MTKMYQLMIEKDQINDLYYDVADAIANAKQLATDMGMTVTVWVAEDIEGVFVDMSDWTILTIIRYSRFSASSEEKGDEKDDKAEGVIR